METTVRVKFLPSVIPSKGWEGEDGSTMYTLHGTFVEEDEAYTRKLYLSDEQFRKFAEVYTAPTVEGLPMLFLVYDVQGAGLRRKLQLVDIEWAGMVSLQ